MSNECSNRIEIIGDKDVITRLFELVKSEERDWGKDPIPNKTEEENKEWLGLEFDFNKVLPYPTKFKVLDDAYNEAKEAGIQWDKLPENGYKNGGYDWCIENWGTGSNSTNAITGFMDQNSIKEVKGFNLSDCENPAYAFIEYTTPWAPALPVTAELSKQFPELTFKHSYEEEGMDDAGYKVWKAGFLLAGSEPVENEEMNYEKCLHLLFTTKDDEWDGEKLWSIYEQNWEEEDDESEDDEIVEENGWSIRIKQDGTKIVEEYFGEDENVEIPDGINVIGEECFANQEKIKTVVIPQSVTKIMPYAFSYCPSLRSVNLPDGIIIIREGTFQGCTDLESIALPESVKYIGDAFSECTGLQSVVIPDGVIILDGFSYCENLSSVNIPKSVKWLGSFRNCSKLASIKIPKGIKIIANNTFEDCTGLVSVELEDGVETIFDGWFKGCTALTEIKIPASLSKIGKVAFVNCINLSTIRLPNGVKKISKDAFINCPKLVIHAPKGSYAIKYAKAQEIKYIEE